MTDLDCIFTLVKDYQVLISASLAFLGTLYIIKSNKINARRKNAADVICAINDDEIMNEGLEIIKDIMKKEKSTEAFRNLGNLNIEDSLKQQQTSISYVLNRYEYLAVGIACGTYDEEIIKRSSYNKLIRIYDQCTPMIQNTRSVTGRDTIWSEMEELAKRWKKNPLKFDTKKRNQSYIRMLLPW